MKRCPKCNKKYDDSWGVCINCSTQLISGTAGVEDRLSRLENQAKQILSEIEEIRTGKAPAKETAQLESTLATKPSKGEQVKPHPTAKEDTETQIGKYILGKIGVISVVAGVAFLIAYTFRYLTPVYKILIGYAVSSAMLYFGLRTEKNEKFKWYGRGLIGGGWALAYFTTFAMHHVQATRIIQNQLVDLILLSAVVSAMIVHLFKYRSQTVLAMTLFLGYLTAGISGISYFTFIYITLLAIATVILAYKMDWRGLAFFSLIGTYFTHLAWIMPQIYRAKPTSSFGASQFWLSIGFIAVYWIIYNVIPFIMRSKDENDIQVINGFVLINSLSFGLLGFFEVYLFNPDWRFGFAIIAALVLACAGFASRYSVNHRQINHTYYVISLGFATSSLPFKLDKTWVNFMWLAEIPILIYLGIKVIKHMFYRVAACLLSIAMMFRLLYLLGASKTLVVFMGKELSVRLFVFAAAVMSFYLIRYIYLHARTDSEIRANEEGVSNVYTVLGTCLLLLLPVLEVQSNLVTLMWGISAFILFAVGFLIKDRFFRYAAMGTIAMAVLRLVAIDLSGVNTIYRILVFISLGIILLLASYWYTKTSAFLSEKEK